MFVPTFLSPAPVPASRFPPLPRLPRRPHPLPPSPRRRAPTNQFRPPSPPAWQQTLLPPDPDLPSLQSLHARFPSIYLRAHLLGLDASSTTAFLTAHTTSTTRRPSYAISSRSLALPLPSPSRIPAAQLRDALSLLYATPSPTPTPPLPPDARLVAATLPSSLRAALSLSAADANALASTILPSRTGPPRNRVATAITLLNTAGARIEAAVLVESAGLSATTVSVRAAVYLAQRTAVLGGAQLFADAVPIDVEVADAIALAAGAEAPLFVERVLYDDAATRVRDMVDVFAACGGRPVELEDQDGDDETGELREREMQTAMTVDQVENEAGRMLGQVDGLTAEDVGRASDAALRGLLRRCGLGVKRRESRESLLGRVAPLLDEVARRELAVMLAAQAGDYALAAELQRGRSRRGKLTAELKQAERDGEWGEVVRLAGELKVLERQTYDTTAEPGSYDRDLDQDEWYRPVR